MKQLKAINNKLQRTVSDSRYCINAEYTGKDTLQYVLRFNGDYMESVSVNDDQVNDLILSAIFHADERNLNLLGA